MREVDEKDYLEIIKANTKLMQTMVETNENQHKRRFKLKLTLIICLTVVLISFFIAVALCEPTYVTNNNTATNNNHEIGVDMHAE